MNTEEKGAQGYEEVRDKKELSVPSGPLCENLGGCCYE